MMFKMTKKTKMTMATMMTLTMSSLLRVSRPGRCSAEVKNIMASLVVEVEIKVEWRRGGGG